MSVYDEGDDTRALGISTKTNGVALAAVCTELRLTKERVAELEDSRENLRSSVETLLGYVRRHESLFGGAEVAMRERTAHVDASVRDAALDWLDRYEAVHIHTPVESTHRPRPASELPTHEGAQVLVHVHAFLVLTLSDGLWLDEHGDVDPPDQWWPLPERPEEKA